MTEALDGADTLRKAFAARDIDVTMVVLQLDLALRSVQRRPAATGTPGVAGPSAKKRFCSLRIKADKQFWLFCQPA